MIISQLVQSPARLCRIHVSGTRDIFGAFVRLFEFESSPDLADNQLLITSRRINTNYLPTMPLDLHLESLPRIYELKLGFDRTWTSRKMEYQERARADNAHVTLFLFEGTSFNLFNPFEAASTFPLAGQREAIQRHAECNYLSAFSRDEDSEMVSLTWLAAARQELEMADIDKKIFSHREWDSQDRQDPASRRLDHIRYTHSSTPYRPYQILQEPGELGEPIIQAQRQGVTLWLVKKGDRLVGESGVPKTSRKLTDE